MRVRGWVRGWLSALITLIAIVPAVAAARAPFQLKDLCREVQLWSPQISPNGKWVAVIMSIPVWKTDTYDTKLELVNVATGDMRALTHGHRSVSEPRWSPDGMRLAFISRDPRTKEPQVFVMPMDGGDPLRVTADKQGVATYAWSPNGKLIAFIAEAKPLREKAIKAHDKVFRVTDGSFLTTKDVAPWQLWVTSATGGAAQRLTTGKFSLNTASGGANLAWSQNGKEIAFTKYPTPYYGESFHSMIAEAPAAGGAMRTLISAQASTDITFAPKGDHYAVLRPPGGNYLYGAAVYVGRSAHPVRNVTQALARNFNAYAWLPSGRALLLQGQLGTRSVLWKQPLSGAARLLDLGNVQPFSSLSVAKDGEIAFIGSTATHPNELYVMASVNAKPRQLTDVNAFVSKLALGRTRSIDWVFDRFHEDGVITYPVDYRNGQTYPLVLVIHGGPQLSSTTQFSSLSQLLSASGFLVFQPNYRGSNNLGNAYESAIFRDTGNGPGKDVMAGLAAVEKLGIVAPNRIGVSGWSQGGYMTAWLTSHYNIWKAAVAGAPFINWVFDYTYAHYQQFDYYFFGGTNASPWIKKDWKIYRAQSVIPYAGNVKAPTLLMACVFDTNVPFINADEWYHALRDNGVTVAFYAYPEYCHFPSDIVEQTDVYRRWLGWMKEYLH